MDSITQTSPTNLQNPLAPLFGVGFTAIADGIPQWLYLKWQGVEQFGTEFDWSNAFEEQIDLLRQNAIAWYESGLVAWKLKLQKTWRRDYQTFAEFCEKALGKTASCVNNWIRAARTISVLLAEGFEILPSCQAVALELAKQPAAVITDLWRGLVANYPPHEITTELVKQHLASEEEREKLTKSVPILLPQWEQIKELAAQAGIPPTKFLQGLIAGYLGNHGQEDDEQPGFAEGDSDSGEDSRLECHDQEGANSPSGSHPGEARRYKSHGGDSLPPGTDDRLRHTKPDHRPPRNPGFAQKIAKGLGLR